MGNYETTRNRRIESEEKWWNASLSINLQSHEEVFLFTFFGNMKRKNNEMQWWIHFDDSDSSHYEIMDFLRWMIISFNDKVLTETYPQMRFNDKEELSAMGKISLMFP